MCKIVAYHIHKFANKEENMMSILSKIIAYLFNNPKQINELYCRANTHVEDSFVTPKTKKMKTLLANKQTDDQKRSNEFARYQFIMAMMNMDEKILIPLLKKDGKFLGHLNNWQFLNWLRRHFKRINPHAFHSKFEEGISLDYYPGSEMFEFSFAPMEDNSDNRLFFNEDDAEEDVFKNKMAFQIKLVLLFENGKIADIRVPKKIASLEITKKYQQEN